MQEKLKGAIDIALALVIGIIAFLLSPWLAASFAPLGYAGVFIFSLVASATILLPVPSWILVFSLASSFNPLLLGICAGLGSGIGELSGYLAGKGGNYIIGHQRIELFEQHKQWIIKAEAPFLFLLAFLPNPLFDIAGIAAGVLNVPVWRFLLPVTAGKILRFIILAYLGLHFLRGFV